MLWAYEQCTAHSGDSSECLCVLQLLTTSVREQLEDTTLWMCFTRATTAGSDATTTAFSVYRRQTSPNLCRPKCLISSSTGAWSPASDYGRDRWLTVVRVKCRYIYLLQTCCIWPWLTARSTVATYGSMSRDLTQCHTGILMHLRNVPGMLLAHV